MAENYDNILKGQIGRVTASVKVDNYFPVKGETVQIDAVTKWGQTSEWQIKDGGGETINAVGNLTKQRDSKSILVVGSGELHQKFIARNKLFSVEVLKTIYAMQPQDLPYFSITAKEIVRVGESGSICITMENGYVGTFEITVRVYKENEAVVHKVLEKDSISTPNCPYSFSYSFSEASERGIYDVEVDVTDTDSGITITKRHNKLITVTPALCQKPADTSTGFEVAATYQAYTSYVALPLKQSFDLKLWRNVDNSGLNYAEMIVPRGNPENSQWDFLDVSVLPAGTTLCLKKDPLEPASYPMRLFLKGNKDHDQTNENGTPNFSYEKPLIITHDDESIFNWGWRAYGAFQPSSNLRNLVIDGRGYHDTGIYLHVFDDSMFSDSCITLNNGTSDIEVFGLDIYGAGFAGLTGKTDPNPDRVHYWRENGWEMHLKVHHCKFRYTTGEGVYIGYFNNQTMSGKNKAGVEVSYHPHLLRDLRLYRCLFDHNGYDGVQINNAVGTEVCYCDLIGSGYRREPNQDSAWSCTFDGKVYNCTATDCFNIVGIISPMFGDLEIFNNIFIAARGANAMMVAYWAESLTEYAHPDNTGLVGDDFKWHIYNNVIKGAQSMVQFGDVRFSNFKMFDNILISEVEESGLSGSFSGDGNIFLTADVDYPAIDTALKVADSANYDYQPAYNSQIVTAGRNGRAAYDMRGYRNWYNSNFHSGPLMGIYKDTSIVDAELVLTGIQVNDGAEYSYSMEVVVLLMVNGAATQYRIGEMADLSSVAWQPLTGTSVNYTLSTGYGNKTVYVQVANANAESVVVSSVIEYRKEPVSAELIINNSAGNATNREVNVRFAVSGAYTSLQYMLSEDNTFAGCSYADYTANSEVPFTLSEGAGDKTLYGKIKTDDGQELSIQSEITLIAWGIKLATGYVYAEIGFDAATGINKFFWSGGTRAVKDVTGASAGQVALTLSMTPSDEMAGSATGVDSGIYPDVWISHRNYIVNETADQAERFLKFDTVPDGVYRVNIYCNGNHYNANKITETINTYFKCNGQEILAADHVDSFINNFHDYITFNNVQVTDGTITITCWGMVTYPRIPINIVEIERIQSI